MAGTIVVTAHQTHKIMKKLVLTATADASAATFPDTILPAGIEGFLIALETNPGGTGPTDQYDITIEDANGHDVLETVGGNRSITATEKANIVYSSTSNHPPVDVSDVLTLKIANNSVNSAVTVISLYYGYAV